MIITPFFNRFLDNHIRLPAFNHAGAGAIMSDGHYDSDSFSTGVIKMGAVGAIPLVGVLPHIELAQTSEFPPSVSRIAAACIGVPANLLGTLALVSGHVAGGAVGLAVSGICSALEFVTCQADDWD